MAKLAGEDKKDQIAFMVDRARKMSSKTYMKAVLESIPEWPSYLTLEKYTYVLSLINQLLPIAAGSENSLSQKKVFKSLAVYAQTALRTKGHNH